MLRGVVRRVTYEIDTGRVPFKEGESLYTYAQRVLQERGVDPSSIADIAARVQMVEVTTLGSEHPRFACVEEKLIVDVVGEFTH